MPAGWSGVADDERHLAGLRRHAAVAAADRHGAGCVGLFVALADAAWSRATGGGFEQASGGEAARME